MCGTYIKLKNSFQCGLSVGLKFGGGTVLIGIMSASDGIVKLTGHVYHRLYCITV